MTMTYSLQRLAPGLAALILALPLVACDREGDPLNLSLEQSVPSPQSRMEALALVSTDTSTRSQPIAALPPEAGTVASVRSHAYVNGFRQDVILTGSVASSVKNSLTILARTSSRPTLDEAVPLYQPTEAAIRSELSRQFPRISMNVVERPSSNSYGPYGLALGRVDKDVHCLYMWQWIDENRIPQNAAVNGPISVRVRLCQRNTTFDAMAALLDHLSIGQEAIQIAAAGPDASTHVVSAPAEMDEAATPRPKPAHRRVKREVRRRAEPAVADANVLAPPQALSPEASATPLSGDLPPQAYLGPKASATKGN